MSGVFDTFVAESMRLLMAELNRSVFERSTVESPQQPTDCLITIDRNSADAETHNDVTLFTAVGENCPCEWFIFFYESTNVLRGVEIFSLKSKIPADSSNEDLVDLSHQLLLFREPEPEGRIILASLLRDSTLTRQDLISLIAWSSEAKAIGLRAILVPSTHDKARELLSTHVRGAKLEIRMAG